MIRNFLVEGKSQLIRLGLKGNCLTNASVCLVGDMIQVSRLVYSVIVYSF
jgi:hypothetical protein